MDIIIYRIYPKYIGLSLMLLIITGLTLFYVHNKKTYTPIKTLPLLTVSYNNKDYTVPPGSINFTLDLDNGEKEGISASVHSLPVGLKNDVIIVEPNSKLKINTSYKADKMNYCVWNESTNYKPINRNILITPEKPDTYIYQIECLWEQGRIIYGFRIKVE